MKMQPVIITEQMNINLKNCVLWSESDTLTYLEFFLEKEMGFQVKFHNIEGDLVMASAVVWYAKYGEKRPMNVQNAVIIEFESEEGVDFLVNLHKNQAISFERPDKLEQPNRQASVPRI